jgi:hypothetical protein
MTRVIVSLALPLAMGRMYAHLARTAFENEPITIKILGNVLPAEHVAQKRSCCVRIVGVDQRVAGGNHGLICADPGSLLVRAAFDHFF